ncbi:PASTA domain-containing protein [bacterium]|nr:MAG: PASTA domain-containing protein [bacterium]
MAFSLRWVLLFELLTGRKPYVGDTPLATAMRHGTDPTPRVRDINASVPMVLDEIIAKAMSKDPASRYASAGEMAADLRLVQDALRFGRTLSWPLRPGVAPAPAKTVSASRAPKPATPGRVAPKMSAIQDDDDEDFGKPERDVPAWASIGLALVACVAVSLLAVYFVLNLNRPRLVTVPSVRNFSVQETRTALERYKLNLRVDPDKAPDDKVKADLVIGTDPPDRTRVREGTTIVARVSAGPAQVTVPDLMGLTPDSARSQLEKLGLVLDDDLDQANKPPAKAGTIVEQEPQAKAKVPREAQVHVTIQDDSLPPPQTQRFDYTLKVDLVDLRERARVKIEVEDLDGKREVHNSRHSPRDQFTVKARARGEKATFRIYYDDRLVKTITQRTDGQNTEVTP